MNVKKKRRKVISCGTITYKFGELWEDTEILLVKQFQFNDAWGIPKGHINFGESYVDCAIRETEEETGIQVAIKEKLPDVMVSYRDFDKQVISYIATQICDQKPYANGSESEVADAQWFKVDQIPQIQSYQRNLVTSAIDRIKEFFNEKFHK